MEQKKEREVGVREEGGSAPWAVSNRDAGARPGRAAQLPGLCLPSSKAAAKRISLAHLHPAQAFGAYMAMRRATVVLKRSKM